MADLLTILQNNNENIATAINTQNKKIRNYIDTQISNTNKAILTGEANEELKDTYDTLLEIQKWIESDGVDTTGLTKAIAEEATLRGEGDKAIQDQIDDINDKQENLLTSITVNQEKTSINNNLIVSNNLSIGDGAEAIAPNSLALGIVKSNLPTKSEGLASLAVGGDAVASGKYSIANGCQVQTGIPIWEIRKLISNLFTNNKITKTSNSSTNIITCTCTSAEIGQKTAIAESLTLNFSTKNSTAINNYCIVDNNCTKLDIPMVADGTNENEKNYWINKNILDSEFVNIIDNININNIGNNTFATGFRCSAIGQSTAAIGGWGSEAIGDYSIAIGNNGCKVTGKESIGIGRRLDVPEDGMIRIGKNDFNLAIDNNNSQINLCDFVLIKDKKRINIGDINMPNGVGSTILLGLSDKQYLRINNSGCTFTGNVNLPTSISVPENFIEDIWS